MTPRRALTFTLAAGGVFLLLLSAVFILQWMQPRPEITLTQIPEDTSVMPLDGNGIGSQTISGTQIAVRLEPYPAKTDITGTLRLIVVEPNTTTLKVVTPTLFVVSQALTDTAYITSLPMQRQRDGSYSITGNFFPNPGGWRLRIELLLDEDDPYSVIALVNAE